MIVTDNDGRVELTASGSSPNFPYDFAILDKTHIEVMINGVIGVLFTDYDVTGVGNDAGGTVVTTVNPSAGIKVILTRKQPTQQLSVYTPNEDFPAKRIENDLGMLAMRLQQVLEVMQRIPTIPKSSLLKNIIFPEGIVGDLLRWKTTTELENILPTAFVPGAVTLPLSFANGGTNTNAASRNALLQALGIAQWTEGASLSAASTLAIPNPRDGNRYPVTGNTTITALDSNAGLAGTTIWLAFSGTPQLTHSASLQLFGAVNHVVVAGEMIQFTYLGSSQWRETIRLPPFTTADAGKFWRGDGTWQRAVVEYPLGSIFGLIVSNNAGDATNDIDIAAGEAIHTDIATFTNRELMTLSSAYTKQLDAAWAVGTNQGMRDTGAIADNTWHIFIIKRTDTGVTDILASLSPTAPTMPTNYTKFRRIGSIMREAGVIVGFSQEGDEFLRKATTLDVNATNPGTAAVTATFKVPTGIKVMALLNVNVINGTNNFFLYISALDQNDEVPSNTAAPLATTHGVGGGGTGAAVPHRVRTNTSAQARYRIDASGASDIVRIATRGWVDTRGRNS